MQLNNLGKYQKKLGISVLLLAVVSILAWHGAIRKTLVLHQQINQLEKKIQSSASIMSREQKIKAETAKLNQLLGINDSCISSRQIFDELISISDSIGDIKIVNFPETHEILTNGYCIKTIPVDLEGDYFHLLKMIRCLERDKQTGRLVSVKFQKKKDYKKNNEFLSTTLLFQSYELIPTK